MLRRRVSKASATLRFSISLKCWSTATPMRTSGTNPMKTHAIFCITGSDKNNATRVVGCKARSTTVAANTRKPVEANISAGILYFPCDGVELVRLASVPANVLAQRPRQSLALWCSERQAKTASAWRAYRSQSRRVETIPSRSWAAIASDERHRITPSQPRVDHVLLVARVKNLVQIVAVRLAPFLRQEPLTS